MKINNSFDINNKTSFSGISMRNVDFEHFQKLLKSSLGDTFAKKMIATSALADKKGVTWLLDADSLRHYKIYNEKGDVISVFNAITAETHLDSNNLKTAKKMVSEFFNTVNEELSKLKDNVSYETMIKRFFGAS